MIAICIECYGRLFSCICFDLFNDDMDILAIPILYMGKLRLKELSNVPQIS